MSVYVRIRNGMIVDGEGNGGASEGDIRGPSSDIIEQTGGVVDVTGGQLLVTQAASPAMTVVVAAGVGYIPNNSFDETDSDSIKFWEAVVAGTTGARTLVIGANSSGQTRIDIACVKIDPGASPDYYASDVAELIIVAGTPGAGVPATPSYYLKLAEIEVINGASSITNVKITDTRVQLTIKEDFLPTDFISDVANVGLTINTITSSATPSPIITTLRNLFTITALAAGATVGVPTGTPANGMTLILRIKDNGTARSLAFNAIYRAIGVVLPTTTVISKTIYLGMIYNSTDTKWDVVGVLQEE